MDARLQAYLAAEGGDILVSADPGLVRMLTGHTTDVGSGPSPFALPAVVVAGDGPALLVCSEDEAPEGDHVFAYEGFTIGPVDPAAGAASALDAALARGGGGRIVLDAASVPAAVADRLPAPQPAGPALADLGSMKTPDEVAAVEASLRLCEAGQQAAREATAAGADELELWAAVAAAVERAAGGRTTMIADLVSGTRCEEIGGPPKMRRLAAGDAVLCDLVPRHDGMWGDSCATWTVGEPDGDAVELHAAARAALEAGLAALVPGAMAGDVDRVVRGAMADAGFEYPHHSGHGVGFRWHEEPRIVPGSRTMLAEGMVVALEPGSYGGGRGLRVEQVAVVEANGSRVLSRHSLELTNG